MVSAALRHFPLAIGLGLVVFALGMAGGGLARAAATVQLGGVEYVDLAATCARFGLKPVSAPAKRAVYQSQWSKFEFELESRDHVFNGLRVFTAEAVRRHRGKNWVSRIDAETLLMPIMRPGVNQARIPALQTVVIDPGHGGRDPGKVNAHVKILEKDATLDTARRLKGLLEQKGYKVFLTRTDDRYLDLPDRAKVAARHRADLLISIHFNSVEKSADKVTGVEVFALTPRYQYSTSDWAREKGLDAKAVHSGNRFDHWNTIAAYTLHRSMIAGLGASDRGLKRARWKVIVDAPCPAAYIEAGYLSHDGEARRIADPAYRQKIATTIADGVQSYRRALDQARAK